MTAAADDVGCVRLSGWTVIELSHGIELMPSAFVSPGDRREAESEGCAPRRGRLGRHASSAGDLVGCSPEWRGFQIAGSKALETVRTLADPYGIKASCTADPGAPVPHLNLSIRITPPEVLEGVTRHAGLLYFEDQDGNLVLVQTEQDRAATRGVEGQLVLGRCRFCPRPPHRRDPVPRPLLPQYRRPRQPQLLNVIGATTHDDAPTPNSKSGRLDGAKRLRSADRLRAAGTAHRSTMS